jgi:hypothetical protein
MEEDIKIRFDGIDKRLESSEKRFDDMKWYFGGVVTLFTIGFSVLTLILSWNYSNERASLREFQKDLKAELGKIDLPPELEILGTNGEPLMNQEVKAIFVKKEDGSVFLYLTHFLKNVGNSMSGLLYMKLYTSDPIVAINHCTDEPKFQYEVIIPPKNLDPNEIPGRMSIEWTHWIFLRNTGIPPSGKYPALIKIYYGKGKVAQANFFIHVAKE